MDVEEVKITCRNIAHCESFEKDMKKVVNCDFTRKESIKDVCNCDVLVTTTPVREPVVKAEWIHEGTHINAIGADAMGKQELESSIMKKARIIVDDIVQASHSGEVNIPLSQGVISESDIYAELGEVVAGVKKGRLSDEDITIFDSTGLAVQDLVTANIAYTKAVELGIGKKMKLF
jgi:alanine dehydrogenase